MKFRQDELDHKDIAYEHGATKKGLFGVLDKVINSEEVLGANYFIEKYHKKFQFWIITGTPTTSIAL